ncbi:helix-turn-helix domain-containing protein [Halocatena salina]|uniref:Helix-turn-helix domain-containing protein n=1 Tax=Halocatena salina TaxID=2934340 RepID=A0A8U0A159_9EURY|nr:helix-turn-helix domain-containing protein [Halocatena salina]UPM42596.1 helix-turn-helix domain-containing protein [Halocatena salina]
MKYVRCTLRFSESMIHPVHQCITEDDAMVKDQLLHGNRTNEMDTFLFYVEGGMDTYASALDRTPQIREYELTPIARAATGTDNEEFYAYVKQEPSETDEQLFDAFTSDGVIVVPPIDFLGDGTAKLTVLGEPAALSSVLDVVPDGVHVDVDRIGEYDRHDGVFEPDVTDRQYEALVTAFETGYYELPRQGSLEEIAREMGCSTATASEHLRKAERKIIERFVVYTTQ